MFIIQLQENMNQKFQRKIYHANINVDLKKKNVIQINRRIMLNVMYMKKIGFGIWLHVVATIARIMDDSVIT